MQREGTRYDHAPGRIQLHRLHVDTQIRIGADRHRNGVLGCFRGEPLPYGEPHAITDDPPSRETNESRPTSALDPKPFVTGVKGGGRPRR